MSLLDSLPHLCKIGRVIVSKDSYGGDLYGITVEQTDVECWEQAASDSEIKEFEKRGQSVTTKVYFASNPNVTERHRILITERNGTEQSNLDITDVANLDTLEVSSVSSPDASVGLGVLWRIMCRANTGHEE